VDLTWLVVAIAGCVALAVCIAMALWHPMDAERRRLRPIANAGRLTMLPEYLRAKRIRTRTAMITMALLVVTFAASIVVAARPTGLPTSASRSAGADPEDIMLCIGAPVADPAVGATLRYFADQMDGFGTQRIGMTSSDRRVVPLTRDYQYAKATFSHYAQPTEAGSFAPAVAYVDYDESVEDLLGLCLTGFPDFDREGAQRRSLIYLGPGQVASTDERHRSLFTAAQIADLAAKAGVQVNALVTGSESAALAALIRDSGGQSFAADADVATHLAAIRNTPPATRFSEADSDRSRPVDSPDVPLVIALLTAVALAWWPVVQRR
jgi:hypothetical protein